MRSVSAGSILFWSDNSVVTWSAEVDLRVRGCARVNHMCLSVLSSKTQRKVSAAAGDWRWKAGPWNTKAARPRLEGVNTRSNVITKRS